MFGEAGDYDGIRYVLQEMKSLGVKPNLVVFNTLLEAMGKAGKPGLARSLFEEMVAAGVSPDAKTLTSLVKIYGKARWARDALDLWQRMKSNGWPMDFILYNTLLSMCADLGLQEEAEKLFEDMKGSENCKPDSWSYTAMLNIYGSGGNVEKAMTLFDQMSKENVAINVMGCTCLIQCLGRAKRIDDLVMVFETSLEKGVRPDDRLCGCLLSVVSYCENGDDLDKVIDCLQESNPRLVYFVKLLEQKGLEFEKVKDEFKEILNNTEVEARRPFCNCFIDICRKRNLDERAHELLYLGTMYGLYPGLHTKTPEEWRLNVRSLSVGAAHTAFEEWIGTLSEMVNRHEPLPELLSASTGAGTHKYSQGLANAFESHVMKLSAPFRQSEEKPGVFVASRDDVVSWVQSKGFRFSVDRIKAMPKNKGKGGKNRKRGKNEADDEKRELVFKEDGQEYAQVLRMLGNGRCEAMCIDGTKRLCHIRGKMHKKVWIAAGDIILVGLRDYQDDKADVILKYMPDEARLLKAYGELPENIRLNEGIAGGIDEEDDNGGDDYIEFEDEDIDKI
ncbi:hypothetical protein E3N88_02172 [Mikania micrantha]|uniref:Eukaryotic translation initiation factor 4C n=2 Tax=Mikania micrantha TaxID=192012 RepID=A0A5N6Q4P9_9ASTR|nr:hypothetical protein E3N88_02172 [Mikania micrantha]